MNNNQIRPPFSPQEAAAMMARFQQTNPQMFARMQAMRPALMETANEHLLTAASTANTGSHGHSHTHSSSCKHSHAPPHFSQPVPEPPPKPAAAEMSIVQAVQYNEMERVKELIESGQANVNSPDPEGCYLLHWASINNHVELVRYLIAKGATVDIKGGDLQSTPAQWACRQGCAETFFILIDNGAAIDSTDTKGVQPIHLAAQYGQIKMLAFLLGSGIDVDCCDERGFTPLIYSCLGPPPDHVSIPSSTFVNCTQFLITFGADVNHQDTTRHYTPLHFAINTQNAISFHVLLKNPQINIHLKNSDNCDPISFARLRHNLLAVETLSEMTLSNKLNIRPKFLQPYFAQEHIRAWSTRFFMFIVMTSIGLSANSYEYPYWARLIFPIVLIFILAHIFSYYAFDTSIRDNFAFSYVLSSTLLMYVTYIIYLQNNTWTLLHICYHLSTIYGLYSFRCIRKYSPGFLKQQTMSIDGNNLTKEKICIAFGRDPRWTLDHFCVTCLIRRPLRSKHCPVDRTCVAKFDHHCTWLGACIGSGNYFYFIRVLTCGTVALLIWMYQVIHRINNDMENYSLRQLFLTLYDPWFNYMLILTCLNTIWVALMTGFHLFNSIYLGVTLNERLTGFRYSYFRDQNTGKFHNPFRKQLLKNFLETFGCFRLMAFCRYPRIDWSQIYDINQIDGTKLN